MPQGSRHDTPRRRILAILRSTGRDPLRQPLLTSVSNYLTERCPREWHLAFSSADGSVAGFYLRTGIPLTMLRAELEESVSAGNRDFVLVLELGLEFAAIGNNQGWQWLQHHPPTSQG